MEFNSSLSSLVSSISDAEPSFWDSPKEKLLQILEEKTEMLHLLKEKLKIKEGELQKLRAENLLQIEDEQKSEEAFQNIQPRCEDIQTIWGDPETKNELKPDIHQIIFDQLFMEEVNLQDLIFFTFSNRTESRIAWKKPLFNEFYDQDSDGNIKIFRSTKKDSRKLISSQLRVRSPVVNHQEKRKARIHKENKSIGFCRFNKYL